MNDKSLVVFYIIALPIAGFILGDLGTTSLQLLEELKIQEAHADQEIEGVKYQIKLSDGIATKDILE